MKLEKRVKKNRAILAIASLHLLILNPTFVSAQATTDVDDEIYSTIENLGFDRPEGQHVPKNPYGFRLQFSMLPDNHIDRETNSGLAALGSVEGEKRENSGLGLSTNFTTYYRHKTGPKSQLILTGTVNVNLYKNSGSNTRTGLVSLTYERDLNQGSWSIAPFYRYTWKANDADIRAYGALLQIQRRLSPNTLLQFSARAEDRDYFEQPDTDHDGPRVYSSLGVYHDLGGGFALLGGARFKLNRAQRENLKHNEYAVFARTTKSWQNGLELSFGVDLGRRRHLGTNQVLRLVGGTPTLLSITRQEDFYSLTVTAENPELEFAGFTPSAECSYTDTQSNIRIFSYAVTSCKLTISRNF